jgi:hypothetical protein
MSQRCQRPLASLGAQLGKERAQLRKLSSPAAVGRTLETV